MCGSTKKIDEALVWWREIFSRSFEQLQNSGWFPMLDHKLGTCVLEVLGDNEVLSKEIFNKERAMAPLRMKGRQYVKLFLIEFEQDENCGAMYVWEDLKQIHVVGDKVTDLRTFLWKWEAHLARMKYELPEEIKMPMFLEEIKNLKCMQWEMWTWEQMDDDDGNRTYAWLLKCCKKVLRINKLEYNREDDRAGFRRLMQGKGNHDNSDPAMVAGGGKGQKRKKGKGKGKGKNKGKGKGTPALAAADGAADPAVPAPHPQKRREKTKEKCPPGGCFDMWNHNQCKRDSCNYEHYKNPSLQGANKLGVGDGTTASKRALSAPPALRRGRSGKNAKALAAAAHKPVYPDVPCKFRATKSCREGL